LNHLLPSKVETNHKSFISKVIEGKGNALAKKKSGRNE